MHRLAMTLVRNFYLILRYKWQAHYLLPLLLIFPPLIMIWDDPFGTEFRKGEPVVAKIERLGVDHGRYNGRTPGLRVLAKTTEGAVGTTIVLPREVEGCRIGDPIRAQQVGLKLYLEPAPCLEGRT